jgi:serine/threonine protein kinase
MAGPARRRGTVVPKIGNVIVKREMPVLTPPTGHLTRGMIDEIYSNLNFESESDLPPDEKLERILAFWEASNRLYDTNNVNLERLKRKKFLGKGSYGLVYKVLDETSGKFYALKELKTSENILGQNDVRDELIMLSSVNPMLPNGEFANRNVVGYIASSLDWMTVDKQPVAMILSEFVDGKTLWAVAKTPERWDHALRISQELFNGLAFIHSKGITHRDIKPENVMIERGGYGNPYGRVVIVDLGLSCFVEQDLATTTQSILKKERTCRGNDVSGGTYIYQSPEIAWSYIHAHVDAELHYSADVWASAVTLVEFLWAVEDIYFINTMLVIERNELGDRDVLVALSDLYDERDGPVWQMAADSAKDLIVARADTDLKNDIYLNEKQSSISELASVISTAFLHYSDRPSAMEMLSELKAIDPYDEHKYPLKGYLGYYFDGTI